LLIHAGGCALAFSLVAGVAGVAATSQTLALIPAVNKSLSTALTISLIFAAMAFAGMFVSSAIGWEILSPSWQLFGQSYTAYDSLLLAFAGLTLLMLVTIGLIPKVVKKKQLVPGSEIYPRI